MDKIAERLEYLRGEIEAGRISYGELAELQDLAEHIDPGDVVLLQWAGVPEDPDDDDAECPGHESTGGAHMGESVYCDGSCQS